MIESWSHIGPTVAAAFLASMVEFVEALTVVLAVGATRGWRSALAGTGIALLILVLLVLILGPALSDIPLRSVQLIVGVLLLLFGLRWLRKAILRSAGVIPLHDETVAYAKETEAMQAAPRAASAWDSIAILAAFKITMTDRVAIAFESRSDDARRNHSEAEPERPSRATRGDVFAFRSTRLVRYSSAVRSGDKARLRGPDEAGRSRRRNTDAGLSRQGCRGRFR